MKTCPNCGNQVADEALFCNNCGTNVANVAADNTDAAKNAADAAQVAGATISAAASASNAAAGSGQSFQQNVNFGGQPQPQNFQPVPQSQPQPQPQQFRQFDPSDHTNEFDPRDIADNKLFAVLPYFTFILGIIVALLVRESAYTKFHAKNAIRIEIALILALIPSIVPVVGWLVTGILLVIISIVKILAIVSCFQGQAKDLPIIGNIAFLK